MLPYLSYKQSIKVHQILQPLIFPIICENKVSPGYAIYWTKFSLIVDIMKAENNIPMAIENKVLENFLKLNQEVRIKLYTP